LLCPFPGSVEGFIRRTLGTPSGGRGFGNVLVSTIGRKEAVDGLSREFSVFPCRPFNFKTPKHAIASTTMLHFGVYVAVPRGTKTDFDVRVGLFTCGLGCGDLCYQRGLTRAGLMLTAPRENARPTAMGDTSQLCHKLSTRYVVPGTCSIQGPGWYCKLRSKSVRG
jgi:hypothetical protein